MHLPLYRAPTYVRDVFEKKNPFFADVYDLHM